MLMGDYSGAGTLGTRTIKVLAICNGTAKTAGASWATPTNGASAFTAGIPAIWAANFYDDVYFADEQVSPKFYDSSADSILAWTASAGSFPTGGGKYPRLIGGYHDRILLAGLGSDPQNFFASAMGDPTDFDYAPAAMPSTRAYAGNQGNATVISDKITAIVPVPNADYCFFGGDHTLWQMSGDIASGGRMDRISDDIGMAWGRPFCFNRQGMCYFWSSRGGVYVIVPNGTPKPVSEDKLPEELKEVNTTSSLITMNWDDRYQGIWIFVKDLGGGASTNYYYCERTESFWKDTFATNAFNPVSTCTFDGDDPDDRAILIGSGDGYVRKIDRDVYSDDDVAISSSCYWGPFYYKGMSRVQLMELQATLAAASSNVTIEVYGGDTAEEAFAATAFSWKGTLYGGRNQAYHPMSRHEYIFLKLYNNTLGETWSPEKIDITLSGSGHGDQRLTA